MAMTVAIVMVLLLLVMVRIAVKQIKVAGIAVVFCRGV
jgi:hypothetical protein